MIRLLPRMLFLIALVLLLGVPAAAEPLVTDAYGAALEQADALGLDGLVEALPEEARSLMGEYGSFNVPDFGDGLSGVLGAALSQVTGIFRGALRNAALILAVAILCGLAGSICATEIQGNVVTVTGVLAIAAVTVGNPSAFIGLGGQTLSQIKDFAGVLLPVMAAAGAAGGAITSASAQYAATMLFLDVLLTIADQVIMPLVYAYIAVSVGNAAFGGDALRSAAGLLKWIATILLTGIVIVFVAYLTITGVVSGSTDALTTRVAKTAVATILPVVGGILTDAASTVVAGAGILRNTTGVLGMLATIAICAIPFLRLGASYLLYKLAAGLMAPVADARLARLTADMSGAFAVVLGLVGAGALMLFITLLSMIKMVTGL